MEQGFIHRQSSAVFLTVADFYGGHHQHSFDAWRSRMHGRTFKEFKRFVRHQFIAVHLVVRIPPIRRPREFDSLTVIINFEVYEVMVLLICVGGFGVNGA